jgi:hypothetical protein
VFNFPGLYTDDLLSESGEHLRLAAARVETAPEIYRKRVAFVRAGLTYSQLLIETIGLMESYWRKKDDSVATRVLANWEERERLCQEYPFAINWGPVRPTTPRMIGLHPDHPNPKWKPNKANDLDRN